MKAVGVAAVAPSVLEAAKSPKPVELVFCGDPHISMWGHNHKLDDFYGEHWRYAKDYQIARLCAQAVSRPGKVFFEEMNIYALSHGNRCVAEQLGDS